MNIKLNEVVDNNSNSRIKEQYLDFPLQVGEACEIILDEKDKYWKAGVIVSMTLDREFYIVKLVKDDTTHRVSSVHIRRPLVRELPSKRVGSKLAVRKPQTFRPRKAQPDPEGHDQWKKFSKKMIKK